MRSLFCVMLLMLSIGMLTGCGGETGPKEHSVSGKVTLDGQPLPDGSVLFKDPAGKTKSYFAQVKDGTYSTNMQAGKWEVQITANRQSATEMVENAEGTAQVPAMEQYLPAKYNTETTLNADVTAGGENTFNFDLQSE